MGRIGPIDGIAQWNSFLRPLIILNQPESYPLSVGLRYFVVSPADGQPKAGIERNSTELSSIPPVEMLSTQIVDNLVNRPAFAR